MGGLVMGVLTSLPFVSAGNVCCCLWVVGGGLVGSYLLQQNQSRSITAGDGALVGLLAGLIGALVAFGLSIPIGILVDPMLRRMADQTLQGAGSMPPAMREFLESFVQPRTDIGVTGLVITRLVMLMVLLFVGAIFSTLGGLLGVALFRRRVPANTIDPT